MANVGTNNGALVSFDLEMLFRYAKARGLIDAAEELGARQKGRAGRAAKNPVDQLLSLEYINPETGSPLSGKELYQPLAADYGLSFEVVDKLGLDPKIVAGIIGRSFAEKRLILPLRKEDNTIIIGIGNPLDDDAVQTVAQLINSPVVLRLILPSDLLSIAKEYYGLRQSLVKAGSAISRSVASSSNLEQLLKVRSDKELEQSDQHVINAVDYLFRYAIEQRASDIHFEPKRNNGLVRMRIDGVMHVVNSVPMHVFRALTSRVKTISRLDIAERRLPQDGRIKLSGNNQEIEMRVSTLPVVFGEKVVLRLFDPTRIVDDFCQLGFSHDQDNMLQDMLKHTHGMILVTGPTGSGKSTTLYCALRQLAKQPVNIVSIEDPVEMILEDLNQVAVQQHINLGFSEVLRTILRQDPDIIMVGEIRDQPTARHAVQAALTGHLVLSTLHTNDAYTALGRMLDLGVDRFFLAQVLRGLTAQRLVRRVCDDCALTMEMADVEARMLGAKSSGDGWTVTRGQGCDRCRHTGFSGRTTLNEIIAVTPELGEMIAQEASRKDILAKATSNGYQSLRSVALEAVLNGVTTPEEAIRVVSGSDS